MATPLITVIIPAYNQGDYLDHAIQSVLDQSVQNFEVVVVNDGSTDHTPTVAESFGDPRVHVIHQENKGLAGARNTGIMEATSPWLLFLDSDDWLLSNAIELFFDHQKTAPSAGVIIGGWVRRSTSGLESVHHLSDTLQISLPGFLYGNPIPVHSALVRKEWVEQVGCFDESLAACEDWDLWLRLLLDGCEFTFFNEPVCIYRIHDLQMTRQSMRMRSESLAMLDKVSRRTKLPAEIQIELPVAYAGVYLRAAARGYRENLIDQAREDVEVAVKINPKLIEDDFKLLASFFSGWAYDSSVRDPAIYLETVYSNLPSSLNFLAEKRVEALGRVHIQSAFACHQRGDVINAGRYAIRAICQDPSYLVNRGVWSILFKFGKFNLASKG